MRPSLIRVAAEMAAKLGVTVRLEGDVVIVTPKGMDAEDDFDMVRMKRK